MQMRAVTAIRTVAVTVLFCALGLGDLRAERYVPIAYEVVFTSEREVYAEVAYYDQSGTLVTEPLKLGVAYPVSVEVSGMRPGTMTAKIIGSVVERSCVVMPGRSFTFKGSSLLQGPVVTPLL